MLKKGLKQIFVRLGLKHICVRFMYVLIYIYVYFSKIFIYIYPYVFVFIYLHIDIFYITDFNLCTCSYHIFPSMSSSKNGTFQT